MTSTSPLLISLGSDMSRMPDLIIPLAWMILMAMVWSMSVDTEIIDDLSFKVRHDFEVV